MPKLWTITTTPQEPKKNIKVTRNTVSLRETVTGSLLSSIGQFQTFETQQTVIVIRRLINTLQAEEIKPILLRIVSVLSGFETLVTTVSFGCKSSDTVSEAAEESMLRSWTTIGSVRSTRLTKSLLPILNTRISVT